MNNILKILFVVLIANLFCTGCNKSSSTPAPFMKATTGTTTFSVSGTSQAFCSTSSSGGIDYIYISGEDANGKKIRIVLIDNSGTGTIQIGTGNAAAYYYPGGSTTSYTYATSGSVTITSLTPDIAGTFSFTCADSTVVTNGSFSVLAP